MSKTKYAAAAAAVIMAAMTVGCAEEPDPNAPFKNALSSAVEEGISQADPVKPVQETPTSGYEAQLPDDLYTAAVDAIKQHRLCFDCRGPITNDEFITVFNEVCAYHPDFFWFNTYSSRNLNDDVVSFDLIYTDGTDLNTVSQMQNQLYAAADEFIELVPPELSDIEKIRYIHDLVIINVDYDYENYYSPDFHYDISCTAYGALVNRKAVCQGYAKAFQLLLNRMGYDCVRVNGTVNGAEHGWCCVSYNGQNYWVDVTFDDPDTPDSFGGQPRYDYFMVGNDTLFRDHVCYGLDKNAVIPDCPADLF